MPLFTFLITLLCAHQIYSYSIRNYDTTTYPYSSYSQYSIIPTTTVIPPLDHRSSLYANSFSNPTSLTSYFSPDRYSHLNNFLNPNLGRIKLIPPALTNHLYQKFPTTKFPVTSILSPQVSSFYGSSTPTTHLPTSASVDSMESSPVIVRPKKPTRSPLATSHLYETSSSSIDTISTPRPSNIPTSTPLPHYHNDISTKPSNVAYSGDIDSPPGSLGLLYVFSEATKRLPVADFPKRMETYGNNFVTWGEDTVKGFEKQAVSLGDTFVELLQTAAKDVTIKAGELISSGIDTLERSVKSYLSDWIGCAPAKG